MDIAKMEDLKGQRFNRLLVISRANVPKGKTKAWMCRCDCGVLKKIRADHLKTGRTRSCGCYNKEIASKRMSTHGMSGTREHITWVGMKDRCGNKDSKIYKYYGGKGIKVCSEWVDSFERFYKDMGSRPKGHSIDRIDGSLGYSPSNCKWSSRNDQARNRSCVKLNENSVGFIKRYLSKGIFSNIEISRLFNVSPQIISQINKGHTWKDVPAKGWT